MISGSVPTDLRFGSGGSFSFTGSMTPRFVPVRVCRFVSVRGHTVYNGYYQVMSNIPKSWDSYQPPIDIPFFRTSWRWGWWFTPSRAGDTADESCANQISSDPPWSPQRGQILGRMAAWAKHSEPKVMGELANPLQTQTESNRTSSCDLLVSCCAFPHVWKVSFSLPHCQQSQLEMPMLEESF